MKRVLLNESLNLPGYNRVAEHRRLISLVDDIHLMQRDHSIGVGISYKRLLTHTVNRILFNISIHDNEQLKISISDGLDGSGSHRIYQQANFDPDIITKNFQLFCFKVLFRMIMTTFSVKIQHLIHPFRLDQLPF